MNVTETLTEGLKREFRIVIPAADLDERLSSRLESIKGQVSMKGFRPGKVPVAFLRKTYGRSLMGEIVQEAVDESSQKALSERDLRPAGQPKIEFENQLETVVDGQADLSFKLAVELVPNFELADFKSIVLERPVADVDEADVEGMLARFGEDSQTYTAKAEGAAAENGDALTIDFLGTLDGAPFDGGKGEDVRLVLGKGQFIPGFEEQLVGAKAGERRDVKVRFPDDYSVENLKGKDAVFAVTVHEVRAPEPVVIDDSLAERFGLPNLEKLREAVRNQLDNELKRRSREHVKRALLDALDAKHDFPLPEGLVEAEFQQIWGEVQHAFEHGHPAPEDVGKPEDQLKTEYRRIAERRVRLGLVLAEIARRNQISVTQEETNRAIGSEARRYPGQEQRIFQYYRDNPQALVALRAPILEDKVVDFILELAQVTDKPVTKAELMRDPDAPAAGHDHDHDHDHGHDHDHAEGQDKAAKPPRKASGVKKSAKAAASKSEDK